VGNRTASNRPPPPMSSRSTRHNMLLSLMHHPPLTHSLSASSAGHLRAAAAAFDGGSSSSGATHALSAEQPCKHRGSWGAQPDSAPRCTAAPAMVSKGGEGGESAMGPQSALLCVVIEQGRPHSSPSSLTVYLNVHLSTRSWHTRMEA